MLQAEIARYLDNQGILTFDETGLTGNTFIDILPSNPDDVVAIYRRSGPPSDVRLSYDIAGIQFIVRGSNDPRTPLQLAQDIYDELQGFASRYLVDGGSWVIGIIGQQSGPVRLGQDDNGRPEYSLNFNVRYQNKTKWRS